MIRAIQTVPGDPADDRLTLPQAERTLRRRALTADGGTAFLADLAQPVTLRHGDGLRLEDGRVIRIVAAEEPLAEVSGDLARAAWHIGNRHTPCQILPGVLRIARDPVIEDMLRGLGCTLRHVTAPFEPEAGAYHHHP